MKLVLDILETKKQPSENDLIIFDATENKWKIVSKATFLNDTETRISKNTKSIETTNENLTDFKSAVNEKLEYFHKVLQTLVNTED